ncbi:MAG: hypothetical protein WCK00_14405, partial [Deltaproteobacteria bacterium]
MTNNIIRPIPQKKFRNHNFNGLVHHYFLRTGSTVADLQVNFVAKEERKDQSHAIAKRLRPNLKKIGDRYGA